MIKDSNDQGNDAHLVETCIASTQAYSGNFLHIQSDQVRLPNGKTATREYVRHPGAVVILAMMDDGKFLLERQFRYPLNRVFIEFPAGKIDPQEDPLECAKRELREETGYTARHWQFVCTIHNAIAYTDEHLEIYLAQGLVAGTASLDEGEFLDVFAASVPELLRWIREGKVTDVKTIIGAFWLEKLVAGDWVL